MWVAPVSTQSSTQPEDYKEINGHKHMMRKHCLPSANLLKQKFVDLLQSKHTVEQVKGSVLSSKLKPKGGGHCNH